MDWAGCVGDGCSPSQDQIALATPTDLGVAGACASSGTEALELSSGLAGVGVGVAGCCSCCLAVQAWYQRAQSVCDAMAGVKRRGWKR